MLSNGGEGEKDATVSSTLGQGTKWAYLQFKI